MFETERKCFEVLDYKFLKALEGGKKEMFLEAGIEECLFDYRNESCLEPAIFYPTAMWLLQASWLSVDIPL